MARLQGQWSIGIFKGSSLSSLKPVEAWGAAAHTSAAWPVSNPVLTCAHVTDVPSSFVADPFLYRRDDSNWYLLYETKSVHNMQVRGGAGCAGGACVTNHALGIDALQGIHLIYELHVYQFLTACVMWLCGAMLHVSELSDAEGRMQGSRR
jgi:hypothetical protein